MLDRQDKKVIAGFKRKRATFMNEPPTFRTPQEIYRDAQIDDLIGELRVLQSDLCELRWTLYHGLSLNAHAVNHLSSTVEGSVSELSRTIRQTFVPWYLRLWYALRRIPQSFQLRMAAKRAKAEEAIRKKQLIENAQRMQTGFHRFRSRYQ